MESSWVWFWTLTSDSSFLLAQTIEGSSKGSRNWISATHVGGLDFVPGSWLLTPAIAGEESRRWELSLSN